ncbi:MAG TPA: tripartite tricarboxylate transporter TctB family protein [Bosea sp. (in: a-proteobacteria)]
MASNTVSREINVREISLGLILLAIALGGLYFNADYETGTASRMGPGYLPLLVFGLIAAFGLGMLVTALRSGRDPFDRFAWREMALVLGALTGFGAFLGTLGLGASLVLLIVISSLADRTQTLRGTIGMVIVLVGLCWLIFDRGLKIGIPFLPPVFGIN